MRAKDYREFYKNKRRDSDRLRDLNFIGCYHKNNDNEIIKKGFFELYHGDKEDEKGILKSLLEIADDRQAIYEFIQNAVDSNSSYFYIFWDKENLLVINNGNKFKKKEIQSILNFSQSTKSENNENKIGKFGIGFKLIHRLVGKGNGSNEIIDKYKGPILYSWNNHHIKTFLNGDLTNIENHWFFKILYTNFPCEMEETIKDKNYKDIVPFKRKEYDDLVNFMNKQKINFNILKEGTIFFLKLGEGKSELLYNELDNLKNGIKYSLNILKSFSEKKDKTLNYVNINGLEIKSEHQDIIKKDNYIFLSPINEKKSLLFFNKNNNEKISFFKFFPMGDQRNDLNFIVHSDKFNIKTDRMKLDKNINKKLLRNISNSLKNEFDIIKSNNAKRYRNILLNLYLSDLETANSDKLIQEYLTSKLYQYIQTNIPTKNNKFIGNKNLVKIINSELNISLKKYSEFYFDNKIIIREAKKKLKIEKWNIFDVLVNDNIEEWVQQLNKKDYEQFLLELNNHYKDNKNIKDKKIFSFGEKFLSINTMSEHHFFRGTFGSKNENILEKLGFIFSKYNMSKYEKLINLKKKSLEVSLFNDSYNKNQALMILNIFKEHNIKKFTILKIDTKYQILSQVSHTYIKDKNFKEFIKENYFDKKLDIYLIPDELEDNILSLIKLNSSDKNIKERLIKEKEYTKIIDFIISEDDILKEYFMNRVDNISLEIDKKYSVNDYEHKIIQFFIKNNKHNELKSKIYIDGENIDNKLISPVISFKYGEVELVDINPKKYKNYIISKDILDTAYNFENIDSSILKDKIFNFKESDKIEVYEEDIENFLENWNGTYKKTISKGKLEFLLYLTIETNNKKYLRHIDKLKFDYLRIYNLLDNILKIDKESKIKYPFKISDFFPELNHDYYINDKKYALDRECLPNEITKNKKLLQTFKNFGLNINNKLLKVRKKIKNTEELFREDIKKLSDKELVSNLEFLALENEKSYKISKKEIESKNIKLLYRDILNISSLKIFPILKNKSNFTIEKFYTKKYYITRKELNNRNRYFQKRLTEEIKNKNIIYGEFFDIDEIPRDWIEIREKEEEKIANKKELLNERENSIRAEIGDKNSNSKESNWHIGWLGEKYVYELLLNTFKIEEIVWHNENSKSIDDDKGAIDIEVHINGIIHYIEVKATRENISSSKDVRFFISSNQFEKFQEYEKNHHLIFVIDINRNPQHLYFGFNPNWLESINKSTNK